MDYKILNLSIEKGKKPHAIFELGRLYASQGNVEEAERMFKKCIEIDKDKYYDRAYARGHISRKEDHTKKRPQGEVVKNVVDIVNKNEQDER